MKGIRLRLIGILILVAMLPALPAVFTARSLFSRSLDPLLETEILEGARAGLASTREILTAEKERFREALSSGAVVDTLSVTEISALEPREQSALRDRERSALRDPERSAAPREGSGPGLELIVEPERFSVGGQEVLLARVAGPGGMPVWVRSPLPPELVARAARLSESIRLVEGVRRERAAVLRSLAATFIVVYGVILVLVLFLGLYLASRVTRPVAALGRGIDRVAAGDLASRVPAVGTGEIAKLLQNFNEMVDRLRTQQAELVRLEKLAAWRQMARRLAHEIKNPLTPIQLAAEQVRDSYRGDDPEYRRLVEEGAAIIQEEVQALRTLVSDFSQFARMPQPQLAPVSLADLLGEVGALFGEGKVVVVNRAPAYARLICDRDQIHRALINLVNNGLDAQTETSRTDPIEITAETDETVSESGDRIRIHVADRGPGVPTSERRRIFEPDVSTKSQGMGLGLAIVENTVTLHGGTIAVADREGGGAVFTLTLSTQTEQSAGAVS